jgi:pimeloyl-ACP methyl ester carboxylesterase
VSRRAAHEGRSIEVNGAAVYVEQHGSGTPVVLIHGGLMSNAMWEPLLPALKDGTRAITPDSRGHGRSTDPAGLMSFPQIADDVAVLIGELRLDRPVVGGYSDGGQVALELGVRHPDVAGALIVGGADPDWAGSGQREVLRDFLGADASNTPDPARVDASLGEGADHMKSLHPGGEAQWQRLIDQTASMWLEYEGLTEDDLSRIHVPTLVFTGDRDAQIPLALTVSLYEVLPNAELAVCPDADHAAPIRARADVFAAAIHDFAVRHAGS